MVGRLGPGPLAPPLCWGHLQQPSENALQHGGLNLKFAIYPFKHIIRVFI